jgi:hypothetical protein
VRAVVVVGLLLVPASAGEGDLDAAIARLDRGLADRIVSVGRKAKASGQKAAARAAFERALVLVPDHASARSELGYTRKVASWERPATREREVAAWRDADPRKADVFAREIDAILAGRTAGVLDACRAHGTPVTSRPHLLRLLEADPDLEEAHKLLGHERIGGRYVRPELAELARALPERLHDWDGRRRARAEAVAMAEPFPLAAAPRAITVYEVGGRWRVGLDLDRAEAEQLASRTEATYALLERLYGRDLRGGFPPVLLLGPGLWRAFLDERIPDAAQRSAVLRENLYVGAECVAMPRETAEAKLDGFGYLVASQAAMAASSPVGPDRQPTRAQPWYQQGIAYLVTLEAYETALSMTWARESMARVKDPPPLPPTRAGCADWVRRAIRQGTAFQMKDLLGKPHNELPMAACIQVGSFLRFLHLYDADAARRLPAAMREAEGSQAEVARKAFEAAFGKGVEDLEALWRGFVLEVDSP